MDVSSLFLDKRVAANGRTRAFTCLTAGDLIFNISTTGISDTSALSAIRAHLDGKDTAEAQHAYAPSDLEIVPQINGQVSLQVRTTHEIIGYATVYGYTTSALKQVLTELPSCETKEDIDEVMAQLNRHYMNDQQKTRVAAAYNLMVAHTTDEHTFWHKFAQGK